MTVQSKLLKPKVLPKHQRNSPPKLQQRNRPKTQPRYGKYKEVIGLNCSQSLTTPTCCVCQSPTKNPTASPTATPTPAPTEFGSVCRLCPNTIEVGSSGKTLFEMGNGVTTTCGDFNVALAAESSCSNVGYTGTFRGVDVAAYCNCPGTFYPAACGRGLCNDGSSLLGQSAFGLTCFEWNDFALAAVSSDACGIMLDPQRQACCF